MHNMLLVHSVHGMAGNQELYWNWKCLNDGCLAIVRIKSKPDVHEQRTIIMESEVRRTQLVKWNKVSMEFYLQVRRNWTNKWGWMRSEGRTLIQFRNGQKCWKRE